jgi:hypothetical protein
MVGVEMEPKKRVVLWGRWEFMASEGGPRSSFALF